MSYDACKSLSAIPEANGRLLGNGWSRETRDSLSNGHGRVQDRAGITASWNYCWWVKNRNSASHILLSLNNRRLFSENWSVKSTRVFQPWELMLERLGERCISITWGFLNGWVMVCHGGWCWLLFIGFLACQSNSVERKKHQDVEYVSFEDGKDWNETKLWEPIRADIWPFGH